VVEVPKRLPRAAMEALAVIAWHQPVTRAEIEEIRGAGLSQATLESLLEHGLVAPKGHKEVPGRRPSGAPRRASWNSSASPPSATCRSGRSW
jgi:chromosome segregation and condensation protein ScpB